MTNIEFPKQQNPKTILVQDKEPNLKQNNENVLQHRTTPTQRHKTAQVNKENMKKRKENNKQIQKEQKRIMQPINPKYKQSWSKYFYSNFHYHLPESFELFFQRSDLYLINACQKNYSKLLFYFSLILTAFTSIEVGLIFCPLLFLFNYDSLAINGCYLMLIFGIFSQIPKRFVWRHRPFIRDYAIQKRNDYTSSFPSRAVSGSLVYGYWLYLILFNDPSKNNNMAHKVIFCVLVVLFIIFTSFARVYFGVHYPSDCLFGVFLGLLVIYCSVLFNKLDLGQYTSCANNSSKIIEGNIGPHFTEYFSLICWKKFFIGTVISFFITIISISKPIEWWRKSIKFDNR
ncbi:hypothetical protein M0813_13068 [Anaeramoeba flamelloides]|uniref:Phosphatidic acid phosphatase type 2/haloperoxidase domain-containing protein n=1 Tax=Anaeramoeba flamelloides TaxID=1746091 RepID=A0ABQ8Z9U8_9EUKA|nr:hypothetical protein M0813_13068 [Anaeramoeba flamelloides]